MRGVSPSETVRMFFFLRPGATLGHKFLTNQKVFYVFTTDLKISLFLVWVYKRSSIIVIWDSVARKPPHSECESLELCTRTHILLCVSLLSGMHLLDSIFEKSMLCIYLNWN